MFEISFQQLALIKAEVGRADISYSHLQYDLIDHICCDVENAMEKGLPFEKAYEMVKQKVGIRGLQRIQEDTLFLIDKKYRIMKTTMKIFGVVAPVLLAFGSLFKIQHWPGAGVMITLGFFLLTFVFLPSAIYVSYKEVSNRTKLFMHLSGFLAGFLFAVSFLFKIQHWPGAGVLMTIAMTIAVLFFIPSLFINQLKKAESKALKAAFIFGLLGSLAYMTGFLFKMQHWPGAAIAFLTGCSTLMVIAFPIFVFLHYKNRESISARFIFITFAVIWIIVPTSLISLQVAGNILGVFKEAENITATHIQYLQIKNNIVFANLTGNVPEMKKNTTEIKIQSDELFNYIESIKNKIINKTEGIDDDTQSNRSRKIENLENLDKGNIANYILFEEGEAIKIKGKIEKYREFIAEHANIESNYRNLMAAMLSTLSPDSTNSWEKNSLGGCTLITTINKLSGLQEKVLNVEYLALKSLSRNVDVNNNLSNKTLIINK